MPSTGLDLDGVLARFHAHSEVAEQELEELGILPEVARRIVRLCVLGPLVERMVEGLATGEVEAEALNELVGKHLDALLDHDWPTSIKQ